MKELLLGDPFPELACIAESGQKHILFRAKWNPPGAAEGYVQFEEQQVAIFPPILRHKLAVIESMYTTFNKTEIGTGHYSQYRIQQFGHVQFHFCETQLRTQRQTVLFKLALFLAQKGDVDDGVTRDGVGVVIDNLAGSAAGLQAQVHEHLGTVREQHPERGVHQQSGEVRQLNLFENER